LDTELARTFLTVIATGSFVAASQRLHVTQSTASARIQRLEEQLGASLFVRNSAGVELSAAGRQFQRHASLLTRTVEQARQDVGAGTGGEDHAADCGGERLAVIEESDSRRQYSSLGGAHVRL
jgi:LysR family transcriptional regulator, flagellar master operon regulator